MKTIILNNKTYMVLPEKPGGYRQLTDELYMYELDIIQSIASTMMQKSDAMIIQGIPKPKKPGECIYFARYGKTLIREEKEREAAKEKKNASYVM